MGKRHSHKKALIIRLKLNTYIKFLSKLLHFVFIFAHQCNYSSFSENTVGDSFAQACAPTSHQNMLICKLCWLAKSFNMLS